MISCIRKKLEVQDRKSSLKSFLNKPATPRTSPNAPYNVNETSRDHLSRSEEHSHQSHGVGSGPHLPPYHYGYPAWLNHMPGPRLVNPQMLPRGPPWAPYGLPDCTQFRYQHPLYN